MDIQALAESEVTELHILMLLTLRKTYKPNPLALLADSYLLQSAGGHYYIPKVLRGKNPHVYLQKSQQMPAVICAHRGVKLFSHSGLSPSR